ncbi:26176_t:CDS:2, partial [Dentiscutata erythropus]
GFNNPAISSTQPAINAVLPLYFMDNINITLINKIMLSTGNISIYQIISENNYLLRQSYEASTNYNNFVKALSYEEPLSGIEQNVWHVKTSQTYNNAKIVDLYQQIKSSLPIDEGRLKRTGNIQSTSAGLLIKFSIQKAKDPLTNPNVDDIIQDLNDMIENKYISALSSQSYMIFLDNSFGFKVK